MRLGITQNISRYFLVRSKSIKKLYYRQKELQIFNRLLILNVILTLIFFGISSDVIDPMEQTKKRIVKKYCSGDLPDALKIIANYLKTNPNDNFVMELRGKTIFKLLSTQPYVSNYTNEQKIVLIDQAIYSFEHLLEKHEYLTRLHSNFFVYLVYLYFLKGKDYYDVAYQYLIISQRINKKFKKVKSFLEGSEFILDIDGNLTNVSFNELAGYLTFKLNKYKESIKFFKKALINKKDDIYYFYLGHLYHNVGKIDKAINYFEYVANTQTNQQIITNSYLMLINLFEIKENYVSTEKYIRKYLKSNSNTADLCYKRGEIYEKQNKIKLAISSWREALTLDPTHSLAKIKLLRYNSRLLKIQKNIKIINKDDKVKVTKDRYKKKKK